MPSFRAVLFAFVAGVMIGNWLKRFKLFVDEEKRLKDILTRELLLARERENQRILFDIRPPLTVSTPTAYDCHITSVDTTCSVNGRANRPMTSAYFQQSSSSSVNARPNNTKPGYSSGQVSHPQTTAYIQQPSSSSVNARPSNTSPGYSGGQANRPQTTTFFQQPSRSSINARPNNTRPEYSSGQLRRPHTSSYFQQSSNSPVNAWPNNTRLDYSNVSQVNRPQTTAYIQQTSSSTLNARPNNTRPENSSGQLRRPQTSSYFQQSSNSSVKPNNTSNWKRPVQSSNHKPKQDNRKTNKINRKTNRTVKSCTVCLENIGRSSCRKLFCGHTFHQHCITQWMNTGNGTCPNCREMIR